MKATERKGRWVLIWWVLVGELVGAAIPCVKIWPEFSRRFVHAWNGGTGESAVWGEPLVYMIVQGVPAGLLGGALAFILVTTIRRFSRSKPAPSNPSSP